MVRLHPTVKEYWDDEAGTSKDHEETIQAAIDGAKRMILCGLHAVQDANIATYKPLFERYFLDSNLSTVAEVRKIFRKMRKLVRHSDEIDVVIHLGTNHISGRAEVYIPHLKRRVECSIDFSEGIDNAFDHLGRYVGNGLALRPVLGFKWPRDKSIRAFVTVGKDDAVGSRPGRDMFVNPKWATKEDSLRPVRDNHTIQLGEELRQLKRLPNTMFHEFSHTVLLGDKPLKDERVVPADLQYYDEIKRYQIEKVPFNTQRDPNSETCIYGDQLCHFVAKDDDECELTLTNADSYSCFALAVYMYNLGWDYHDSGKAQMWNKGRAMKDNEIDFKDMTELSAELDGLEKGEAAALDKLFRPKKLSEDTDDKDTDDEDMEN